MALSAIGGGVGAGLGASTTVSNVIGSISGNALVQAGIQGALASAITQGIGTATGLQDKFSWAAVAAAGVSRVAGLRFGEGTAGGITAATLADAATRSLIDGSDFGDNMLAALPNMFAQMAMMRPTPRVEAQGSSDDSAPYMSYKSNVLNREVSNAQSPRRGLLSMALDWLGRAIVGDFSPRPDKTVTERDSGADDLSFTEYDPLTIYAVPRDQYGIPRSAVSMLLNSQRTISDERIRDALARASMEGRPATIQSPLYQPGPLQSPIMMQEYPSVRGYSTLDAGMARQNQLGWQGFTNSFTGTGASVQFVGDFVGASYEDQVFWGALGAAVENTAGGMYGAPAISRPGYRPAPYAFEYDYASVNGMGRPAAVSPHRLGQSGEMASRELTGLPRNTIRIPAASGERDYRIPDHLEPLNQRYAVETKNVWYQGLTSQILDDVAHVQRGGYPGRVEVFVDKRTIVSRPLLYQHLNPGSPVTIVVTDLNRRN